MSTTSDQPAPGLDTIALHGGQHVDPRTKARADSAHAARLLANETIRLSVGIEAHCSNR